MGLNLKIILSFNIKQPYFINNNNTLYLSYKSTGTKILRKSFHKKYFQKGMRFEIKINLYDLKKA